MVERDRRLSIRIADDEWDKLHALAEAEGVSSSDYVRLFIRRAHAEKFGNKKPKTKK
jgi:predicted DNA-binding protein